jgi:predicted DNA-binding transcriptional regulator YafY
MLTGDIVAGQVSKITYTNHRGETAERNIILTGVRFGVSPWHPEPQWLMEAYDLDKMAPRTFAFLGIKTPEE